MADDQLRPDIAAAVNLMQNKIGAKRAIRKLVEYLWDNEQVHLMAGGTYGPGVGLVMLTGGCCSSRTA
jgi:hypothetical protein